MSNKLLKHAGIAVMLCSALAGSVMAQTDPWIANEISRQNQRNLEADNKIRAQRARERQLQREIAELRRTPFYMAIAYDFTNKLILRGGGYYTEKRAIEGAMEQCKSSNCQIVATFANTCAVVVEPDKRAKSLEDIFVAFDNDDKKAAPKAMQACEAKHGHNKCSYWNIKKPFCTGYDYSLYGHR